MSDSDKIKKIVWTKEAEEALEFVLNYRYSEIPAAYNIVKRDIISASKHIVFARQYQIDEHFPSYRRIIVRDYKILYKHRKGVVYILNIICTRAKN